MLLCTAHIAPVASGHLTVGTPPLPLPSCFCRALLCSWLRSETDSKVQPATCCKHNQMLSGCLLTRLAVYAAVPVAATAGFIHVTEISKVRLRFWSHDDWKSNISWAYAELRPVLDKQQQHHEQQRKQQWEQWWAQHSKSSRPLLRHRLARALNG